MRRYGAYYMAQLITLAPRPNKQSGRTLLYSDRLLAGTLPVQAGEVIKKFQVAAPAGMHSYIKAKAPPLSMLKTGNAEALVSAINADPTRYFSSSAAANNYIQGFKNALKTIEAASEKYSPGKGFTEVNGLLYTRWQAYLMTQAQRVKSVTPIRGRRPKAATVRALVG
jgi:hypothetical protein